MKFPSSLLTSSNIVLPMCRFDCKSNRAEWKCSGWTNLRLNFGPLWTKRDEKGPNFKKIVYLLILSNSREVQEIFPLTQTKILFFLSPNCFKKLKLQGGQIFSLATKFIFWTSRKVLQRVGNTDTVKHYWKILVHNYLTTKQLCKALREVRVSWPLYCKVVRLMTLVDLKSESCSSHGNVV